VTGNIMKGNVSLPIYRCARGSSSLESFHLHLARFIPGTSASAINFQAFLLDGMTRWNSARATDPLQMPKDYNVRSFDNRLQAKINALSTSVFGEPMLSNCHPPAKYTGELIGVEYLFRQTGEQFSCKEENLDEEIDNGFADDNDDNLHEDPERADKLRIRGFSVYCLLRQKNCHKNVTEKQEQKISQNFEHDQKNSHTTSSRTRKF